MPVEVTTDRAPAYPRIVDELIPTALNDTEQYANNRVEADPGRLKARLRPMRGLKTFRSTRILVTGHAFVQNLRRGRYDIATDAPAHTTGYRRRSMSWRSSSDSPPGDRSAMPPDRPTQQPSERINGGFRTGMDVPE